MKKILLLAIPLMFLLTACGATGGKVTNLSVSDFAQKVSDKSVVVLDVRTPGEFQSGHLSNAINVDYEGSNFEGEVQKLDKSKTYAVYCRSGRRSGLATEIMAKVGFKSIFNLDGGIENWQAAGNQVVTN